MVTLPRPVLWSQKAAIVAKWAQENLWSTAGAKALDFLRSRGLRDETIRSAGLGFIPTDLYRPRTDFGLEPEIREDGRPRRLWIPSGVVIPRRGSDGLLQRIRVRRFKPGDGPRYVLVSGSATCPMILAEGPTVLMVIESEIDCLLLVQDAGDLVGVIGLGSAVIRPDATTMEAIRAAQLVLVALDMDVAGQKETRWWLDHFPNARRLPLPLDAGKDPGEAFQRGLDLRLWVAAGLARAGVDLGSMLELPAPEPSSPAEVALSENERERREERAGIYQYDGSLSRLEAERLAGLVGGPNV